MSFKDWLDQHPLINQYSILEHSAVDDAIFLKLRLQLIDNSVLFTKEYTDNSSRKYAFHWQHNDGRWLIRWDNVPHFPKLASFPHHKHDYQSGSEIVTDSFNITLSEVLAYIRTQLTD